MLALLQRSACIVNCLQMLERGVEGMSDCKERRFRGTRVLGGALIGKGLSESSIQLRGNAQWSEPYVILLSPVAVRPLRTSSTEASRSSTKRAATGS